MINLFKKHRIYLWIIVVLFCGCTKDELKLPDANTNIRFFEKDGTELVKVLKPLDDGGLVYAGEASLDGFVFVVDSEGTEKWYTKVGGEQNDRFYDVVQTPDNGFVAVGLTKSFSKGVTSTFSDGYVVKFSSSGKVEWERNLGDSMRYDYLFGVYIDDDGAILCTGQQAGSFFFGATTWLVKMDPEGNIIWEKSRSVGPWNSSGKRIVQNAEGDYLVAGHCSPRTGPDYANLEVFMAVFNKSHGISKGEHRFRQFARSNQIGFENHSLGFERVGPDYVWAELFYDPDGKRTIHMVKTTINGNIIFDKYFVGDGIPFFENLSTTADGGFLIAGSTGTGDLSTLNYQDGMLIKLNQEGEMDWYYHMKAKSKWIRISNAAYVDGNWKVGGSMLNPLFGAVSLLHFELDHEGKLMLEE